MNPRSKTPFETLGFKLPAEVADALHRRVASHDWDPDRVVAAAILHFIENTAARADMLRRLIEVQGGAPTHTSPDDVLEYHRDEVFGYAASDMVTNPVGAIAENGPQILAEVSITLDEIAENLARCNDDVIVAHDDDRPR